MSGRDHHNTVKQLSSDREKNKQTKNCCTLFLFKYKCIYFDWRLITLQYCIGFAIPQHESTTGIHVFPTLNPPPSSLPVPSLLVVSVHQPQASSIMHRNWTGFISYMILYMFQCHSPKSSHPHPIPRSYHLSKFHIYALVYCIGVFLSGLLHSV